MEEQKIEIKKTFPRRYRANIVVAGLVLITVGVIVLGRNLGWIEPDVYRVLISWQMLLVVLGVWSMTMRHFINGIVLMGVGAFFMIPLLSDVGSDWVRTYWPLIFVLLGIILLIRLVRPARCSKGRRNNYDTETTSDTEEGFVNSYNSFASVRHIVLDPVFRGARIKISFGGTVLDLRKTKLEAPETFIDIDSTFGGLEIFLPEEWTVVDKISPMFAGVEDKRFYAAANTQSTHKLILRGNLTFSGIEIKN